MQDLKKTLNQIIGNNKPLRAQKYDNDNKMKIFVPPPYDELGFTDVDWMSIQLNVFQNWKEDNDTISNRLNDMFNIMIRNKYYNTVVSLLSTKSIPTIILSILCQDPHRYSLHAFKDPDYKPENISEYFALLRSLTTSIPKSYSATSTYVIDVTSDLAYTGIENAVNPILWDNDISSLSLPNVIYGVKHIWDHYDYPHIHEVTSYMGHKLLSLNAVKRTWLSMLAVTAGTKLVNNRLHYGYGAVSMLPNYTIDEYHYLAKLNYGTTIQPPYNYDRILRMSIDEVERIIVSTLDCLRFSPTLNTVYVTPTQLGQERLLGNDPIASRYTVVQPSLFLDSLILFSRFSTVQLPTGESFAPITLLSKIEMRRTAGLPDHQINLPLADHVLEDYAYPIERGVPLMVREYKTYLDLLSMSANRQFRTPNIIRSISPDGITIVVSTLAEQAVAVSSLNEDSPGTNLNQPNEISNAILTPTTSPYISDYMVSTYLTHELMLFRQLLDVNYSSMNIAVVSPELYPVTFMNICNSSNVPAEVYSYDGSIGTQLSSLYNFNVSIANMLFATISETDYLNDITTFELFASEIKDDTYYSLEFLDFSPANLVRAISSIINSLKLILDTASVKLQLSSPILNAIRVGVRLIFSLHDLPHISTLYDRVTVNQITPYTRVISLKKVVIDPIQSLAYPRNVIPRMGTHLLAICQADDFAITLGYMSSLCRYTTSKSFSSSFTYYEIEGFVDQSRIAIMDRLKMFRLNDTIKPEQLIPSDYISKSVERTARLTHFELVTQTDRMLLYIHRRESGLLPNDLSDYGSAHFANICMTDNHYTMYDMDKIDIAGVPGVTFIQDVLEWGEPLPYIQDNDVLIYNSIFMNARVKDDNMAVSIIDMLRPIALSKNIYINFPYMTQSLFELLLPLDIVTLKDNRYFLKLGNFPSIPCLREEELLQILAIFPDPQYTITKRSPTLLDYYFTSRMIQRSANSQVYYNALMLHQCLPFFEIVSR